MQCIMDRRRLGGSRWFAWGKTWRFPALLVLAIAAICWLSSDSYAEPIGDEVAGKFMNNVVRITAKFTDGNPEYGFGFIVGEKINKLYIVTAKHVARRDAPPGVKTTEVRVRFENDKGKSHKAILLDLSLQDLDLALLEIAKPVTGYKWEKACIQRQPERGDEAWFIGRN